MTDEQPPAPETLNTPAPIPVDRKLGIVLSVWTKGGLKFDVPMPDDFTLQAWADYVNLRGYFCDWRGSLYVARDEIVAAVAFRAGAENQAKIMPFQSIDGGKNGTPPPISS